MMFTPGCGCCGGSSCSATLTVTVTPNCNAPANQVVSLTFGSTTLTLAAPNSGANYRFTSGSGSGWSAGTAGTVTVTSDNYLAANRNVTLGCTAATLTVYTTRNQIAVLAPGCVCSHVYVATDVTVWLYEPGTPSSQIVGSGTTVAGDSPSTPATLLPMTREVFGNTIAYLQWSDLCGSRYTSIASFCGGHVLVVCDVPNCGCG